MQHVLATRASGSQFPVRIYDQQVTDHGVKVTLPASTMETLKRENATITLRIHAVEQTTHRLIGG
jgi:hypothetical protein